jgi:3-oxoacyl-[acyl-carrier-protein] synthase-1
MRRVAITGLGIVSCMGNELGEVSKCLRQATPGIRFQQEYADLGLRSHVAGVPDISAEPQVPRKWRRFMADNALYAYHAMRRAIQDAGLEERALASPRIGIIVGSGVGSPLEHAQSVDTMRTKGAGKVLSYAVPRIMGSTASANLATAFGLQGVSFSVSSACASAGHSLGLAADQIRWGKQDIVFAGGSEEVAWTTTMPFDAMGALSSAYQDHTASRPFDAGRDGFVIAGGAGILVLEEWERARQRGARIYAELTGHGASTDGVDMVNPQSEGAARAMRMALIEAGHEVDYINAHATSTPVGDISELLAIHDVFGSSVPPISSTKGLSGHPIAAAAAHEAIFGLLMMQDDFIAGCANIEKLDPACASFPIICQSMEHRIDSFLSNSFGFGGTNVSLVFRRAQ